MIMGYSLSWVAIKGKKAEEVRQSAFDFETVFW
jgi:hypothetical protein